ncbi:hypothetical protein CK22_002490 [Escherichia coli]|nr:hypothetical protein [Escherichia coli]
MRQQRPAGRATQWRVILWHRPNLNVGLIRRVSAASGNGTALIVGCGVNALSDRHTTYFPAKFAPHISLSINGFVTESIVFFYICLNLFLRYLWLALAFSAVRFSVHGINRSDIHLFLRFFSLNA